MAHSHSSTTVSALTTHPLPGLPPLGGTAASNTYSEALTFAPPPQTRLRGVNCPPLPGGGLPEVDLCPGALSLRMRAPTRSEDHITLQDDPWTPYQQQVQVPKVFTTWSSWIGRGALLNLIKKKSEELEQQIASPLP